MTQPPEPTGNPADAAKTAAEPPVSTVDGGTPEVPTGQAEPVDDVADFVQAERSTTYLTPSRPRRLTTCLP
ncbi:hypothetical protein [Fodinicola feengrottensis]|uniref:hypothetical protein n=1 Tax=Fodinicola feengrottensis TaxID=435914 RepID=UPI0013D01D53|nr:hypothetical protein [Fodinicola feengrottensis]